jgi:hypothetical protein
MNSTMEATRIVVASRAMTELLSKAERAGASSAKYSSLEPSIQRWKLSFAVDLPPNLKTGRWRERGRHRPS